MTSGSRRKCISTAARVPIQQFDSILGHHSKPVRTNTDNSLFSVFSRLPQHGLRMKLGPRKPERFMAAYVSSVFVNSCNATSILDAIANTGHYRLYPINTKHLLQLQKRCYNYRPTAYTAYAILFDLEIRSIRW